MGVNMNAYLFLSGAIIFEVIGTLLLPVTQNFSKILPSVILTSSYILSFYFLTFAIKKIPLSIVYASWAGIGVLLIAILGYFFYKQTLSWQAIFGLVLVCYFLLKLHPLALPLFVRLTMLALVLTPSIESQVIGCSLGIN
jgi:small multidrug resistance pump